ncbi:unnamed protein product [Arctogadus glacialis]
MTVNTGTSRAQVVSSPLKAPGGLLPPTKSVDAQDGVKGHPDALAVSPDPSRELGPNIFLELFSWFSCDVRRPATHRGRGAGCWVCGESQTLKGKDHPNLEKDHRRDVLESGYLRRLVTHWNGYLRLWLDEEREGGLLLPLLLRERLSKATRHSPATDNLLRGAAGGGTSTRSRAGTLMRPGRVESGRMVSSWTPPETLSHSPGCSSSNCADVQGPRANARADDADCWACWGPTAWASEAPGGELSRRMHCAATLNQHLKDRLVQQLLQLDEVSILGPGAALGGGGRRRGETGERDLEQQSPQKRLGWQLQEAAMASAARKVHAERTHTRAHPGQMHGRRHPIVNRGGLMCSENMSNLQGLSPTAEHLSAPVLDGVRSCCGAAFGWGLAVLTLPWMVEFLSMMDVTGPLLPCYSSALGTLLLLYRGLVLGRGGEVCYLNKLLMVAALGWLFQIPVIPEDIFFTSDFTAVARLEDPPPGVQGLDCLPLVDQQLLYVCCPFLGEFRKILAAFVSGSAAKSSGILRKITPTSAEPRDAPIATRSQQKLQVDLEQAFFHNQPPSLRRTVEFVAERVGSNCVKHMKATLVSELVQRGEELLRAGLLSPGASGPKLHEAIGAQLSDRGMEAPARATRFCSDKSPDAIRNLLPVETSPVVLTTSENITKRLATEKACSWLAANITALIRREWKSRFDRVMKSMDAQGAGMEPANQAQPTTPKRKPGGERALVCPTACPHAAPLPSDVLIQIKEVLSVGVGPRTEAELPTGPELRALLGRVGEALACRKFLTPVSEQMLLRSTVLLACQIVGGDLPVLSPQGVGDGEPGSSPGAGPGEGGGVLEALADLWERECCWATPLHLLFSELNVTAVLRASPEGLDSYEFLVRRLLTKGLLGEEELASHWRKLSGVSPIQVFTEKFELLPFLLVKPNVALPETLSPTGQ